MLFINNSEINIGVICLVCVSELYLKATLYIKTHNTTVYRTKMVNVELTSKLSQSPRIPTSWLNTAPVCKSLINGTFAVFKTPLSSKYDDQVTDGIRFTPTIAMKRIRRVAGHKEISAVISLVRKKHYYDPAEFTDTWNVPHFCLPCKGQNQCPDLETKNLFVEICEFLKQYKPNAVIGVHCTLGFNRSGFLIASYLIEKAAYSLRKAISEFRENRFPGIKTPHYIHGLRILYGSRRFRIIINRKSDTYIPPSKDTTVSDNSLANQDIGQNIDRSILQQNPVRTEDVQETSRKRRFSDKHEEYSSIKRRFVDYSSKNENGGREEAAVESRKRFRVDLEKDEVAQTLTKSELLKEICKRKRNAEDCEEKRESSKRQRL
ncbi:hypothetical protein ACOME3_006980 [Neoechinorhynchus agilis]